MGLWFDETFEGRVRLGLPVERSLFHGKSAYQTIDIVETTTYGATLLLDSAYMTSVGDEFHYHEMLVHPALTSAPSIGRVLVIGGGDGGTVRELLRYREVTEVIMCEIDAMVTEACKQHLTAFNVPWTDPRLTLHFADGIAYLRDYVGEPFDVILIDGSDPVGPAAGLIAGSFYESCKRCLTPGGVLALQSEAPHLMRADFVRIVTTLRSVFPRVYPYFGPVPIYPSGSWSWTVASSTVDPLTPREDRLAQIERGCRYYNRDIHRAAFAQPNGIRAALAAAK
jgi:spermidine synthase